MNQKHIAILDFGSQYMHLISRRIRQMGVLTKIYPSDVPASELADAWGVILSGGPNDVNEQKIAYDPAIFDLPVPVLGLCYGHQLMAHHYGGAVKSGFESEYGLAEIEVHDDSSLFKGLQKNEPVWMSHWDSVAELPEGFHMTARTKAASISGMADDARRRYGLQFHVEVAHTTHGMAMLENFVFDICNAEKNWSMEQYLLELTEKIKQQVGERNVFLFVSGGVDSTVAFALLEKILGKERVYGLHVDNGFMRLNESALVKQSLAAAGFENLHVVEAQDDFLTAVAGVAEPEEKRNIIGRTFIDVQKKMIAELKFDPAQWMLGQGTIYPDTIESGGTKASDTIKTHHNRIPEIMEMIEQGGVIEPLNELYKDEVRELGAQLGIPAPLLNRWPFPGPGLSIRTLCNTEENVVVENEAEIDAQIAQIIEPAGISGRVLPVRSVGVQGDQRSYQHPALFFNAEKVTWEKLQELSVETTNVVKGVNRVVLHVAGGNPAVVPRLLQGTLTQDRLDKLREAEQVMTQHVAAAGLYNDIWQFPVILAPLSFTEDDTETIVLRPIESQEAMTVNFYPMSQQVLQDMAKELLAIEGIGAVLFDITNKPPATIEWE